MSDPAIEAVERAINGPVNGPVGAFALAAVQEAFKSLRKLHKPVGTYAANGTIGCDNCWDCYNDINETWPCETAKLIYSTEELENDCTN